VIRVRCKRVYPGSFFFLVSNESSLPRLTWLYRVLGAIPPGKFMTAKPRSKTAADDGEKTDALQFQVDGEAVRANVNRVKRSQG
jgi:hypothetical protein